MISVLSVNISFEKLGVTVGKQLITRSRYPCLYPSTRSSDELVFLATGTFANSLCKRPFRRWGRRATVVSSAQS